jgi:adenylylsulfate kinase
MPPTNRCAVQLHRHVVRYRPRPVSCAAARWRRRPAPATAAALGASGNGSCAGAAIGSASVGNAPRLPTTTVGRSTNICWVEGIVSRDDKERLLGQRGCILWFTGAPCLPLLACWLLYSRRFLLHFSGQPSRAALRSRCDFAGLDALRCAPFDCPAFCASPPALSPACCFPATSMFRYHV